jgi:hypothetical protein
MVLFCGMNHQKSNFLLISDIFLSEAVEASRCSFFKNWMIKHKWVTIVTMQREIYHQNYQSFYPSELFQKNHITMRHPVQGNVPETSPFFISPNGCAEQLSSSVYSTWDV